MNEGEARATLDGVIGGESKAKCYAYKDNGSKVLAVAHLDSVHKPQWFAADEKAGIVFSPVLDDRLGLYTILYYLPNIGGVNYDVLLTTGEESGSSTAEDFKTEKQYNWIVEFDRRGNDVALYDFDGDGFKDTVGHLFETARGSFTDICKMESLGAKAFNVGVGYHDEHQVNSYMKISEFLIQMARFVIFYQMHKDTHFVHKPRPVYQPQPSYAYGMGYIGGNGRLYDDGDFVWNAFCQDFVPKRAVAGASTCNDKKMWIDGYGWLHVKEDSTKKNGREVFVSGLGWVSEATAVQVEVARTEARKKLMYKYTKQSQTVHELPKSVVSDVEFITGKSNGDEELDVLAEDALAEEVAEAEKELEQSEGEEDEFIYICKCGETFFSSQGLPSVSGLVICPECGRYLTECRDTREESNEEGKYEW